jgi:hypothetical protein
VLAAPSETNTDSAWTDAAARELVAAFVHVLERSSGPIPRLHASALTPSFHPPCFPIGKFAKGHCWIGGPRRRNTCRRGAGVNRTCHRWDACAAGNDDTCPEISL